VAVQGLGNLLVVALLVAPATAARRVTRRLPPMLAASGGIAVVAATVGLYVSYYADVAAGAAIALSLLAAVGLMALIPRRGVITAPTDVSDGARGRGPSPTIAR
jgi:ABC-type Mn2+/Zn2+ transport system permease subunit